MKKSEKIFATSIFIYGLLIGVVGPIALVIWYWDSIKDVMFVP